ncbi:MAG: hypothetical protein KDD60_07010, partial [Bdellovibrionales bacterium]|nr:hypothetical protein [Bdellovibrionales bacterium]
NLITNPSTAIESTISEPTTLPFADLTDRQLRARVASPTYRAQPLPELAPSTSNRIEELQAGIVSLALAA